MRLSKTSDPISIRFFGNRRIQKKYGKAGTCEGKKVVFDVEALKIVG
jgi:hypothetical protein